MGPAARVDFDSRSDPPRLRVTETVTGHRYEVETASPPAVTAFEPDLPVPVERAVEVDTDRLVFEKAYSLHVRDDELDIVGGVGFSDTDRVAVEDAGTYYLELDTPVKTYLRVDAPFAAEHAEERLRVTFDRSTRVVVSARSRRDRPAHDLTVGEDPHDLLAALSLFGTAVQTASPERTYPTLRGHPPAIALGDGFDAPADLAPPDTGVVIETPPRLETALPVAPLAYYLGASVEPADSFAVHADGEVVHDPGASDADGVATAARRTLERVFVLECAVRTAGLYTYDFEPTRELEPVLRSALGVGIDTVYDWSPARRVAAAFELPYGPLAAQAPIWPHVGYVEPAPARLPALPSLVDTLAPVRAADPPRLEGPTAAGRIATLTARAKAAGGGETRSVSRVAVGDARYADLADLDSDAGVATTSRRRLWVGGDIPLGANQHLAGAARNRYRADEEPTEPPIEVAVVSNEAGMDLEAEDVERAYDREVVDVEITVHRRVGRRRLRELLASDVDFLHYVGHATPDGLGCPDGELDVGSVAETGVTAFCLNACQSYTQGRRLVDAGALGGVVTHGNVDSDVAHRIGRTLSRLLNDGFPLAAAVDVAGRVHPLGNQYAVVGGAGVSIAQTGTGHPSVWKVSRTVSGTGGGSETESSREVTVDTYSGSSGAGAFARFGLDDDDEGHLSPGRHGHFETSVDELTSVLKSKSLPPVFDIDGRLYWKSEAVSELAEGE
jgi:hypothetical protein